MNKINEQGRVGLPENNLPKNQKHKNDPPNNQPRKNEPGLLDEIADKLRFRDRIKRKPGLGLAYRISVGVLGWAIIVLGIFLLPLPGPGWLIIFLGLGILASEFAWAERLLNFAKRNVKAWTRWLARQSIFVKGLVSLACFALIGAVIWGYVVWQGVPGWLPFVD